MEKIQEVEYCEMIDDLTGYTIYTDDAEIYDTNNNLMFHYLRRAVPLLSFNELNTCSKLSKLSRTRGLSAGKPNYSLEYYKSYKNGKPAPAREIVETKGKNYMIMKGSVKEDGGRSMEVNNPVHSSAVGLYAKTNSSNLSNKEGVRRCGASSKQLDTLTDLVQNTDKAFELAQPEAWMKQFMQASSHENLYDTSFTTITVNKNFRTAVHKDKGNVEGFLSSMIVASQGSYHGSYLLFPEYKIGVDIRDGDIIIFNPQLKHCNSVMYETDEDKKYNEFLELKPTLVNGNPYIAGDEFSAKRYSLVFYQRSGFL